jgi:hypothetical protein
MCEKILFTNVAHQMEEYKKSACIYLFQNVYKETY